jgi:hypothetical protein
VRGVTPIFNSQFTEGALASIAWLVLTRRGGPLGNIAFVALEGTANVTLALESARLVQRFQAPLDLDRGLSRAASIIVTLVFALSGAWQWMRGLRERSRAHLAWMTAGYVWMGIAGIKLIASDLDTADTPLRALAFLGVGAIGMAAAVLANRKRQDAAASSGR